MDIPIRNSDTDRITVCGKQIKLDGKHFADAASEEAAKAIAICVNSADGFYITKDEQKFLMNFFA